MENKQFRLPKPFAEKWLAALRSGEYEKGRGSLVNQGCYCALGIAALANNIPFTKYSMLNENGDATGYGMFDKLASGVDQTGMTLSDVIWGLNDRKDLSFPELANWIEQNVEFYETTE